jgi:hypothetical protein
MRKLAILGAAAAALLAATPSSATKLLFHMTGLGVNTDHYSFVFDAHPAIVTSGPLGAVVGKTSITGSGAGVGNNYVYFLYDHGLQIRTGTTLASTVVGAALGGDLTNGKAPNMTFNTGSFIIGGGSGLFRINIGAVPEPATWTMMLLGFGVLGFAMRARRSGGEATLTA